MIQPFKSQKWLACNFSSLYPYIIRQTGDENTKTHQAEIVIEGAVRGEN